MTARSAQDLSPEHTPADFITRFDQGSLTALKEERMDTMEPLGTVSELALALAGFSGIVIVFGRWKDADVAFEGYRIKLLLLASFGAMFLALTPVLFQQMGMTEPSLWILSNLLMGLFSLMFVAVLWNPTRRYMRKHPNMFYVPLLSAILIGYALNISVQLMAAAGLVPLSRSGVFLAGLYWLLAHSAIQFARLLFVKSG